ncbi:hypothetical protein K469DRAFT_318211 [Zopfia rhizophila CBS 207.26]|uniref:Uncharacterized protein n=1 Tax=Zopfia rhizophila CBS 207.26 TaxID=1314779 RepID=A0A6A6EP03_9PEZI|nr:hypothetical protein K469DRAFT_318211 [Zopfia rhizophila CBS 207.26]
MHVDAIFPLFSFFTCTMICVPFGHLTYLSTRRHSGKGSGYMVGKCVYRTFVSISLRCPQSSMSETSMISLPQLVIPESWSDPEP